MLFDAAPVARPDGGLDIERIRGFIASRLHSIPRYRQRLVFTSAPTRPVWVDDDHFNLEYHVRHTSLPRPGTAEQLKRLIGRISSQALDRARPLWELWVVEGLEDGQRFALISKVHHCMIDGISGVELMTVLMSLVARSRSPDRWLPTCRGPHRPRSSCGATSSSTSPPGPLDRGRAP